MPTLQPATNSTNGLRNHVGNVIMQRDTDDTKDSDEEIEEDDDAGDVDPGVDDDELDTDDIDTDRVTTGIPAAAFRAGTLPQSLSI